MLVAVILSVVMLRVIVPVAGILSVVMLAAVLRSVIDLVAVVLSVVMLSVYAECRVAAHFGKFLSPFLVKKSGRQSGSLWV